MKKYWYVVIRDYPRKGLGTYIAGPYSFSKQAIKAAPGMVSRAMKDDPKISKQAGVYAAQEDDVRPTWYGTGAKTH